MAQGCGSEDLVSQITDYSLSPGSAFFSDLGTSPIRYGFHLRAVCRSFCQSLFHFEFGFGLRRCG